MTNNEQWLNVIFAMIFHTLNAFMVFRLTVFLCEDRIYPGISAGLIFLFSRVHIDNILSFEHSAITLAYFFILLSLYYFFKVMYSKGDYNRKGLYLSIFYYIISISSGAYFVSLILFYILIMLIRIKKFKKDFFYILYGIVIFFVLFILIKYVSMQICMHFTGTKIDLFSFNFVILLQRLMRYKEGFVYKMVHHFPLIIFQYIPRGWFLVIIFIIPFLFFNKKIMLRLYTFLFLMYFIYIPFLFYSAPMCDRYTTVMIAFSSIFIGLVVHYLINSVNKFSIDYLRNVLTLFVFIFLGIFLVCYAKDTRRRVKEYISYQASFSQDLKKFVQEFKSIKINDNKKQIYYLKNEIPKRYSYLPGEYKYYLFNLAVIYKELPIDLYWYVNLEIDCGIALQRGDSNNYFISLYDGRCYGYFVDKDKLIALIKYTPDIAIADVIVLKWDNGLIQEDTNKEFYDLTKQES